MKARWENTLESTRSERKDWISTKAQRKVTLIILRFRLRSSAPAIKVFVVFTLGAHQPDFEKFVTNIPGIFGHSLRKQVFFELFRFFSFHSHPLSSGLLYLHVNVISSVASLTVWWDLFTVKLIWQPPQFQLNKSLLDDDNDNDGDDDDDDDDGGGDGKDFEVCFLRGRTGAVRKSSLERVGFRKLRERFKNL